MLIDFPALAQSWAEDSPLTADVLFGELVSAFWRGEFDRLGENGRPAAALVNRNWNAARFFDDDYSFANKPVSRRDLLRSLVLTDSMPECGLGARYVPDPNRHERALFDITNGDNQAIAEGCEKLAALPVERYPQGARDFINNLAITKEVFDRWCDEHEHRRPAFWSGENDRSRSEQGSAEAIARRETQEQRKARTQKRNAEIQVAAEAAFRNNPDIATKAECIQILSQNAELTDHRDRSGKPLTTETVERIIRVPDSAKNRLRGRRRRAKGD